MPNTAAAIMPPNTGRADGAAAGGAGAFGDHQGQ